MESLNTRKIYSKPWLGFGADAGTVQLNTPLEGHRFLPFSDTYSEGTSGGMS